jgi:hypothetical protein
VGDAAETLKLRFRTHAVAWDELDAKQAREHIAVHEAGHAVVGLRHGMRLLDVDIGSDPVAHPDGGFIFGGVRFDAPDGDMNRWAQAQPVETAVVLMAGMCAEEVLLGYHLRESWMGDLRIVRIGHGWLEGMTVLPPEMLIYINDAHEAVTRSEAAISAVAGALLREAHLTATEIAALV